MPSVRAAKPKKTASKTKAAASRATAKKAKPAKAAKAKVARPKKAAPKKAAPKKAAKGSAPQLILKKRGNIAKIELNVTAQDFAPKIAERLSDYDMGVSPNVSWSGAPAEAKSFVVVLEDPDAPRPQPFVHWIAYDIPGDASGLPEGLPPNAEMGHPVAVLQGVNSKGATGYYGPRPPDGRAHRYHLEVFALDTSLDIEPAADFKTVLKAMKGHVIASGETVGEYTKSKQPTASRFPQSR